MVAKNEHWLDALRYSYAPYWDTRPYTFVTDWKEEEKVFTLAEKKPGDRIYAGDKFRDRFGVLYDVKVNKDIPKGTRRWTVGGAGVTCEGPQIRDSFDRLGELDSLYGNAATLALAVVPSPEKFILWRQGDPRPPEKILTSLDQAKAVAKKMAEDNPGVEYTICKLIEKHKCEVTKTFKSEAV